MSTRSFAPDPFMLKSRLNRPMKQAIDPDNGVRLCQRITELAPGEFDVITAMVRDWKHCIEKALELLECRPTKPPTQTANTPPLLSIGPSGLGGAYQKEY